MTTDIRSLLKKGYDAKRKAHAEKDLAKANTFRIGSSGVVTDDNKVYGTCHRVGHLRDIGVETIPSMSTQLLWESGLKSETTWEELLKLSGFKGEVLTQAELVGRVEGADWPLVGHPDIILRAEDRTETGLELKSVLGYSTAILVFFDNKPKPSAICQAATYFLALGCASYTLCYTSSSWIKLAPWDAKKWDGRFKSIPPFYKFFDLRWNEQTLEYLAEGTSEWVTTVITKEGIRNYWRLRTEMKQAKQLGPRLTGNYIDGSESRYGEHSECGLCPYSSACERYDRNKDYDEWLEMSRELAATAEDNE
jgi:hypothetical protein